jgi:hypothetical protein
MSGEFFPLQPGQIQMTPCDNHSPQYFIDVFMAARVLHGNELGKLTKLYDVVK